MVAQEDRPLAILRDLRCLAHDVGNREPVFLGDRHIHARHQRKVESHVALVTITEIILRIFRPLIGLGQEHAIRVGPVHLGADLLEDVMGFGQVLVIGAFALDEIGHRIEPQPVDPDIQPEAHHAEHFLEHARIVEIEIRLVAVEAVPVIGLRLLVPGPVRLLRIKEDDPRTGIFFYSVSDQT